jgi:hypothetical protein
LPPYDLISQVLDETTEIESPKSYFYWSTLAAISAVLKKNVWFDFHAHKVYPNLYILLIGKSGIRKGAPVAFAKRLIREVSNTRLITGRNTIEAMTKELSMSYRGGVNGSGPMYTDGSAFIASPEIAVLLYQNDAAHQILTDWYDTDAHEPHGWPNTLKSSKEHIKDICVTMIGASNLTNLHDSLPKSVYAGGLIGRFCVVYEEKRRVKNSLIHKPKKLINLQAHGAYMRQISQLSGGFTWDGGENGPVAAKFDKWYNGLDPELSSDKTGSAERLHIKVIKTAMCLAAAYNLDTVMKDEYLEEAIEACSHTAPEKLQPQGKSEDAAAIELLTTELLASPNFKLTDTQLLSKHHGDISSIDLDRICQTLARANAIKTYSQGNKVYIELTNEFITQYQKQQKAQQSLPQTP